MTGRRSRPGGTQRTESPHLGTASASKYPGAIGPCSGAASDASPSAEAPLDAPDAAVLGARTLRPMSDAGGGLARQPAATAISVSTTVLAVRTSRAYGRGVRAWYSFRFVKPTGSAPRPSEPYELAWVFGYGSLMWSPGFEPDAQVRATLHGHRRALCLYSETRWGSPQSPGLVMGLLEGGACVGVALGVRTRRWLEVSTYLRSREGPAYAQRQVRIETERGVLRAMTFVATPSHRLFAGSLAVPDAAALVAQARGEAGSSLEYLRGTVDHLRAANVMDPALEEVLAAAHAHPAASPASR